MFLNLELSFFSIGCHLRSIYPTMWFLHLDAPLRLQKLRGRWWRGGLGEKIWLLLFQGTFVRKWRQKDWLEFKPGSPISPFAPLTVSLEQTAWKPEPKTGIPISHLKNPSFTIISTTKTLMIERGTVSNHSSMNIYIIYIIYQDYFKYKILDEALIISFSLD